MEKGDGTRAAARGRPGFRGDRVPSDPDAFPPAFTDRAALAALPLDRGEGTASTGLNRFVFVRGRPGPRRE